MPLYAYKCTGCGAEQDDFNRIDDRDANAPHCRACAVRMMRVISPVRGNVQETCHYVCPATGQGITSWRQRRNVMAENNLVDARDISNATEREKRRQKKRVALEKALRECPQVADISAVTTPRV